MRWHRRRPGAARDHRRTVKVAAARGDEAVALASDQATHHPSGYRDSGLPPARPARTRSGTISCPQGWASTGTPGPAHQADRHLRRELGPRDVRGRSWARYVERLAHRADVPASASAAAMCGRRWRRRRRGGAPAPRISMPSALRRSSIAWARRCACAVSGLAPRRAARCRCRCGRRAGVPALRALAGDLHPGDHPRSPPAAARAGAMASKAS